MAGQTDQHIASDVSAYILQNPNAKEFTPTTFSVYFRGQVFTC